MPRVPDQMLLAKLQALPQTDHDFIMALIDARIARAATLPTRLRLVVACDPVASICDRLRRH